MPYRRSYRAARGTGRAFAWVPMAVSGVGAAAALIDRARC